MLGHYGTQHHLEIFCSQNKGASFLYLTILFFLIEYIECYQAFHKRGSIALHLSSTNLVSMLGLIENLYASETLKINI